MSPSRTAQSVAHAPRLLLMALVRGYRLLLQPWLGNRCRFEPSCSAYALQALARHGAGRGTLLSGWRILRCNPWCAGGCDPVPDNRRWPGEGRGGDPHGGVFTRLISRPDTGLPARAGTDTPATDFGPPSRNPP